jgi:hypothetical protein
MLRQLLKETQFQAERPWVALLSANNSSDLNSAVDFLWLGSGGSPPSNSRRSRHFAQGHAARNEEFSSFA